MKPFFSIIIPFYNSNDTIGRLLASIQRSKHAPAYEVIVVDDGSTTKFHPPAGGPNSKLHARVVTLHKNMGPAVARNRGVAVARGKFVVFADSDVEFFPDTLHNLYKIYKDDPDVVAVTGVWVKEQRSTAFFPNFKALRDWSYWINERDKSGYYFLFSTRIASIKKTVFTRLGGFDETYPAPLVEDIELTYRIARRYAIIFAPDVRVRHEFESFWPVAKKYFLRAYYWTKLYQRRKKFDPVATTWWEALTAMTGVAVVIFGIVSFLLMPILPIVSSVTCQVSSVVTVISCYYPLVIGIWVLVILSLHLFLTRKFLAFMVREQGIVFAVKGFFMGLILYCFIFAGAASGRLR